MDYFILIIAIFTLLFSMRKMSKMKQFKHDSTIKEVKQNIIALLWGIFILVALIVIPYQVWELTGKSQDWDGVYIIGGTALLTIVVSFVFYYKSSLKVKRVL